MLENVIRLRPHHLLCTQGYSGKGYSAGFIGHMDEVIDKLRSDKDVEVQIVFSSDSICDGCPRRLSDGGCRDDDKVIRYDEHVRKILDLKEGCYSYQELICRLDEYIASGENDERLEAVCGDCSWYPVSNCMEGIMSRVKVRDFINTSYDFCTGSHVGPDTIALFFIGYDRELQGRLVDENLKVKRMFDML